MALVYGVLGLVVILTAGTFGTINASPWFNLGIAVLFVVLGAGDVRRHHDRLLALLERLQRRRASRGTFVLAFSMGAVAALLAGACVAPVVIQVVLFSSNLYATGTTRRAGAAVLLGVGMAVPWPIAGAGLAALPKPGAWMVRVKQALRRLHPRDGRATTATRRTSIFANRWVDAVGGRVERRRRSSRPAGTRRSPKASTIAEREDKPVLIDMWATWCKNCLTMDKTTLEDPAVNVGARRLREDQVPGRGSRSRAAPRPSCSGSTPSACRPT